MDSLLRKDESPDIMSGLSFFVDKIPLNPSFGFAQDKFFTKEGNWERGRG
jgi:hypothetical protein